MFSSFRVVTFFWVVMSLLGTGDWYCLFSSGLSIFLGDRRFLQGDSYHTYILILTLRTARPHGDGKKERRNVWTLLFCVSILDDIFEVTCTVGRERGEYGIMAGSVLLCCVYCCIIQVVGICLMLCFRPKRLRAISSDRKTGRLNPMYGLYVCK